MHENATCEARARNLRIPGPYRLPTYKLGRWVIPDFQGNPGQFVGLQNGPFLLANRGRVCPILGIVSSPPPEARNFTLKMSNPHSRLANKNGTILEPQWLPRISPKIRENHGQHITVWGPPILNPNRGRVCPILSIASIPPPEALSLPYI